MHTPDTNVITLKRDASRRQTGGSPRTQASAVRRATLDLIEALIARLERLHGDCQTMPTARLLTVNAYTHVVGMAIATYDKLRQPEAAQTEA